MARGHRYAPVRRGGTVPRGTRRASAPSPGVGSSGRVAQVPDHALEIYADLVRSSPHNLMSPRGLVELETRHIPECLALARLLPAGSLVDIGSGAGLPGIVVAIARPDIRVTVVEATAKKARFLGEVAERLGLDVTVVNARVEAVAEQLAGGSDTATARAVAPLDRLVRWAIPLLRPGGLLYAVKGRRWEEELEAARTAVERAGGEIVAVPPDPRAFDDTVDPPLRAVIIAASGSWPARAAVTTPRE